MPEQTVGSPPIRVPPLRPLLHKARSAFARTPRLQHRARARILCPAEEGWAPPACMLEGQLERLRNFASCKERDRLRRSVMGGPTRHGATIAYTIAGARLSAGSIYAGGGRMPIRSLRTSYPGPAPIHVPEAALCTSAMGDLYFGHFLTEDLLQIMIADGYGEAFRLPSRCWPHACLYKSAFALDWRELAAASFDRLTFFADFAQNALRRARYRTLRKRLRASLEAVNPGASIYLRRGTSGNAVAQVLGDVDGARRPSAFARSPRNDDEVANTLARRGFLVLDVETTAPKTLIETLIDASIIVSVEGSQMMHGVYTLAEDGGVCILMPPMRPMIQVKDRFDALGAPTAILVGEDHGDSYSVNIDELGRTLDLLSRTMARRSSYGGRAARAALQRHMPSTSRIE